MGKFGGIDVLVNNAGCRYIGTVETTSVETFNTMYDVNVTSQLRMSKAAMQHLIKSKGQGNYIKYCKQLDKLMSISA